MATFILYYDMVVSGKVVIEADDPVQALGKMHQVSRTVLAASLDLSTADPIDSGFQLHDANGKQVY